MTCPISTQVNVVHPPKCTWPIPLVSLSVRGAQVQLKNNYVTEMRSGSEVTKKCIHGEESAGNLMVNAGTRSQGGSSMASSGLLRDCRPDFEQGGQVCTSRSKSGQKTMVFLENFGAIWSDEDKLCKQRLTETGYARRGLCERACLCNTFRIDCILR